MFRLIVQCCIGVLYIVVGVLAVWFKSFGTMELTPAVAWGLGILLWLYGAFRVYRAIAEYRTSV